MIKRSNFAHKTVSKSLILLILTILVFGIIMIYNSTVVYSHDVFGGAHRFVFLQIAWILLGSIGFIFFYKFDYHGYSKVALPLFIISIIFLVFLALVGLFPCTYNIPFAPCINGANRWFYINPAPLPRIPLLGILGFQPSEFAKLTLILFLSVKLSEVTKQGHKSFINYILICGAVSGLVLLQPNMSTAVLLFMIGTIIYFASGSSLWPLLASSPVFVVLSSIFVLSSSYRRDRLLTLLGSQQNNSQEAGYHIKQILIALGSGGFFGVGFGQSRQKFQYLPEVAADSIFAIIGEELGFLGTTFVIVMFGLLIYKGYKIAVNAPDLLGKLLSIGIISWLGLQFFVNIAAMTKIIPLTGVPIPLISYGGSSMLFSLMGLGILANIESVSRTAR